MRIAVMALQNAADARMNTSRAIRLAHSSLSLRVIGVGRSEVSVSSVEPQARRREVFLLVQRRSRIVRQLVFAGVRALDFQFVEEQGWADHGCWHAASAVADQRVVAD